MGRKNLKKVKDFQVNDFVFAKVRGYRPWPARILQKEEKLYCVYFYGTRNIANVRAQQIYEYEKSKARLGRLKESSYSLFRKAMEHAENSATNPENDHDFFKSKAELVNEVYNGDSESEAHEQPWSPKSDLGLKTMTSSLPFIHITGDSD